MITDQKQTGVPSGSAFSMPGVKARTQLVKPNQVNNVGRSAPAFNPVRPAVQQPVNRQPVAPSLRQAAAPAANQLSTPSVTSPTSSSFAPSTSSPSLPVRGLTAAGGGSLGSVPTNTLQNNQPPVPSNTERARELIRGMTSAEISTLLDELATGALRGVD